MKRLASKLGKRRKVGVDRQDLVRILSKIKFSQSEIAELKRAMSEASRVFGWATYG